MKVQDTREPSHPVPGESSAEPNPAPDRWVDAHGDYLYGYAMVRLRDPNAAQDAVQETFLAALRGSDSFRGVSNERGWLLGILKHKIHDSFRKSARETPFTRLNLQHDQDTDQFVADGFQAGHWREECAPSDWPSLSASSLDQEAFWTTFGNCMAKLPKHTAQTFQLRELDGISAKEICHMLQITENNLWVLLHRARLALRRCLEVNWFGKLNQ